ncbi:hypothetical protein [Streptomyces sp. C8S0]|uniref:hypothetical protein n=1 Tax=Streptomyces sp. C8S0 TaxID=2585716 RepID=UPI001D057B90|nr:hypothetical protein [Streptomyces sp. C8S0]
MGEAVAGRAGGHHRWRAAAPAAESGPLVQRLLEEGRRVEFETNGTVMPDPALLVAGVRFNVSPKLASFGMDEAKSIVPSVLRALAESGQAVFKFVASSVADVDRIAELVDRHGLARCG